jgi:hypothetical protein
MEFDLEKGISEVIQLNFEGLIYIQVINYKQFQSNYNYPFHDYGNCTKDCKKHQSTQNSPMHSALLKYC